MASIFDQPTDPDALRLTHAIALQESGGNTDKPDYNAVGDNGTSHGAYQWQPGNFESAAKDAGLDPTDRSPANQDKVAYSQVKKMKDSGLDPGQIASSWNSGSPNNYKDHSGDTVINGKSIHYDTPAYVKGVQSHYQKLLGSSGSGDSAGGTPDQGQGFVGNVGNDISKRANDLGTAVSQGLSGEINPLSSVLQSAGAVAGGVGDIVGEGAKSLYQNLVPEGIRTPINQAVGGAAQAAVNSPAGQAVSGQVQQFQQQHPEASADIGAVGNIAALLPIGKGLGLAGKAAAEAIPTATRLAAKSGGILGDLADKKLFNEALDVVAPKETSRTIKQGIKQGRGTVGGVSKTVGMNPDQATINAAQAAKGIVSSSKTAVENASAVKNEISATAEKLKSNLKSMEITPVVSQDDLKGLMDRTMGRIGEDPTMVGNAEESAKRILKKFQSFLPQSGDVTAEHILDARQKLDQWIGSLSGGSNVFDPAYENAKTIALRAVRQEANGLLAEKAPDVGVKEALAHQSALYDALDNIASKGTKEMGTGRLTRFGQRHPNLRAATKVGLGVAGYEELKQHLPFLPLP